MSQIVGDMDVLNVLGDNRDMSTPVPSPSREPRVVAPPEDLQEMLNLARLLESHSAPAMPLGPDGEQIPLPLEVYEVLRQQRMPNEPAS